ncbi:hypothetical protein C8Q77DRAFT_891623 [Trametes polyzona]|nr:hypothetical protein C8Q77DRAFT_891623 [Trametes polyzona]
MHREGKSVRLRSPTERAAISKAHACSSTYCSSPLATHSRSRPAHRIREHSPNIRRPPTYTTRAQQAGRRSIRALEDRGTTRSPPIASSIAANTFCQVSATARDQHPGRDGGASGPTTAGRPVSTGSMKSMKAPLRPSSERNGSP